MRYKLIPGRAGQQSWTEDVLKYKEVRAIAQEFADRHKMPVLIAEAPEPHGCVLMREVVHPEGEKAPVVR